MLRYLLVLTGLLGLVLTQEFDPLRQNDPVEISGSKLFELVGADPKAIVGFRYDPTSPEEWIQIPIQIDEMHFQEWEVIKPGDCRLV
jgi:hypothetical protein